MFYKAKHAQTKQRFTIKKYSFGAASVLIGTFFAVSGQASAESTVASAVEVTNAVTESAVTQSSVTQEAVVTETAVAPAVESETVVETTTVVSTQAEVTTETTTVQTESTTETTVSQEETTVAEETRVAAANYKVQYSDVDTKEVVYTAPAKSVNKTTTTPTGVRESFEVTETADLSVPALAGYRLADGESRTVTATVLERGGKNNLINFDVVATALSTRVNKEFTGFRGTITGTDVAIDGGKATATATLTVEQGTASLNYTIKVAAGAYQPGDKLVLQFEENLKDIPGDALLKELKAGDKVVATLEAGYPKSLYVNKDNVGSYWSQRNDSQTMDQKKANDIQNRGTLLELSYVFTDVIKDVQNFEFSQNIKTGTQYPRIEADKEVTSVFRVNGTDVAKTTYTQKGEPISPALTGNFSMHSNGEIKLNSDNEFVSKNETITMITNSMSFETGTTFKLKINELAMNQFKALGDSFPVVSAQAMGGSSSGIAQVNEHGVILFGQRIKPKFQIVSLTNDTIEVKLVEGKMESGYTYQFDLKSAGAERTLEDKTIDFINAAKTEIKDDLGTVTVTNPDGSLAPVPTGSTPGAVTEGEVRWSVTGPNLSNMNGNFVTKLKALGNLALSYVDAETGNSLIPTLSLINEQITDIAKRRYDAKTPATDLTNPSTDTVNNTVKNNVTAGDVTTLEVTPPYLIQDADGTFYTFAGYYETPAAAEPADPDAEPTNTDPIGYPDAFIDGEMKDSKKLASGVQRIVAKYNKVKMGTVVVRYLKDNTRVLLQPNTPTKYDGTSKLENIVGEAYDVADVIAPKEITDENGLVYVLNEKELPANVNGNLTEKVVEVDYRYVPKAGKLIHIKYENEEGVEIGKDVNLENRFANEKLAGGVPNLHVGSVYDGTAPDFIEPKIVEGDTTYVPRPVDVHKPGSAPLVGKVGEVEETIVYVYIPLQKAEVKYILDTTKAEIDATKYPADKGEGIRGETIQLSTEAKIKTLVAAGYELVTDGFKPESTYDNDAKVTQTFEVILKEKIVEIPEGAKPGQPVDPSNPDGPKWPDTIANLDNKQEVNQEVDYLFATDKSQAHADATDKVTFTRKSSVNLVTGVVSYGEWTPENADTTFDVKKSPVVTGFLADKAQVEEKTGVGAEEDDAKYKEPVLYSPVGSYVVTNPNGTVDKTPYPNDPTDPTKPGTPTNVIPYIPGYTPVISNGTPEGQPLQPVDPTDPSKGYLPPAIPSEYGKDTPISYTKHELVTVTFEDVAGKQVAPKVSEEGFPGTGVPTEALTATIDELRAKGYSVKENNVPEGVTFDNDPNAPQDYKVVVEEPVVPFDSENPPQEGTPIDPSNPNGPKWTPELIKAVTETATTERVTRTVKYKTASGVEVAPAVSETLVFKRETKINVVTKEIITGEWQVEDTTFDEVKSPVVTGYLTDTALVPAKEGILPTDVDSEVVVIYTALGAVVITDPNGKEVRLPYPNDPTDPTKPGVPTYVIPFIEGFTPFGPDGQPLTPVDPADPTKGYVPPVLPTDLTVDTPVTYKANPKPVVPVAPSQPTKPAQPAAKATVETLPNTGDGQNGATTVIGLGMLLGALGFVNKRRKDDNA